MLKIVYSIIKFKIALLKHLFRRGRGVMRFLLWIDDFIRLFAMTLFFSVVARIFNMNGFFTAILIILGAYIDFHDFMSDNSIGKFDQK